MNRVWKTRQRSAYAAMWKAADRKRRRERFIAGRFGWIVEVPGVVTNWWFVITLIVLLSFYMVSTALAADERQIRRDCTYDALRWCKSSIAKAVEAASREPIIACMLQNRDKLQAKCSRHLF